MGCRLVGVVAAAIQIVDIESESQPFVGVDRKIRFKPFFSVYFASGFVVSQVAVGDVTVGKVELIRTEEETGERFYKMVGASSCPRSKKRRDMRGEPKLPR